jgi:nucleoside-diphosphate-sugar epimerase
LRELHAALCEIIETQVPARYESGRRGDVAHSLADIRRAEELLGYRPRVSVREGLERTVAWYRARSESA